MASTAAFQPGPNSAVYYATKAYVLSFTEALAEEVRRLRRCRSVPGPGSDGRGISAAHHQRDRQPAVPARRDGRRPRWPGPGTMACGGAELWSFPACATAPWRLACACPRASLSPRSPATSRRRPPAQRVRRPRRPSGRVRLPRTRHRRARAGPARIPGTGPLHPPRYAISPRLGQGAHCRRYARRSGAGSASAEGRARLGNLCAITRVRRLDPATSAVPGQGMTGRAAGPGGAGRIARCTGLWGLLRRRRGTAR